MKVIVLAAGEGTRLRPLTLDRPKCLVELAGKPLIAHQIDSLRAAGIDDITLVTGYRARQVEALGYPTRHNPDYDRTNMVATLMCAADILDGSDDVLISYADIVYEAGVVEAIARCSEPLSTTMDRAWRRLWQVRMDDPLADAETMKLDAEGNIIELGKKPSSYDDIQGQYMGLIKVGAQLAPRLPEIYRGLDPTGEYDGKDRANMYMTSFLQHLIDAGHPLRAVEVENGWLEVDSTDDLALYERLHAEGRLGEFWKPAVAASIKE